MAKNEDMVVAKELLSRSEAELRSLLAAKVEDLHKTKFNHALGQLRETHTLKLLKKEIARLETVLRQQAQNKEQQG